VKELIPAPNLASFRKEVDRFLERLREGDALELLSSSDWVPNVEFAEKTDSFVVSIEVPGIDPKDIEVLFRNGLLTVRGKKEREATEDPGIRFHRSERSYGGFERNLRLPAAVDDKLIAASCRNGLLTVTLPKTAETRAQTIPVKTG